MSTLRQDADKIIKSALDAALPDNAVRKALDEIRFGKGKIVLVAAGKAAWQMAKAAWDAVGSRMAGGVVVTKYDHSKGSIGNLEIYEAGHPVSDENSYLATQKAIDCVSGLSADDNVLFLLSGGGSALFEKPLVSESECQGVTKQLLKCGANIVEMNTIRKRLSAVKGGRFAQLCAPAHVFAIVLSDIIGDPLDMIASGPAYPDSSTCAQAQEIAQRYGLELSADAKALLAKETPKKLDNVTTYITGSVRQLCASAMKTARDLGYSPVFLSASLECEARDAGSFLASVARDHQDSEKSLAFIAGGETVVHLTGHGLGGRNQEIALSAAEGIADCRDTCVFSVGSDGTDGPTDAAGGYCDNGTKAVLASKGVGIKDVLADNDAYHALQKCDGLIMTGATGTNVNDLTVLLIKR
ncbi:MAG: glycerate kinase [Spirochaetales bacterium]|nr:glycerate kinase [Spirochaetales bacterium]MBQ5365297.1 glycerate kinase [Spirochaetales bacterium]